MDFKDNWEHDVLNSLKNMEESSQMVNYLAEHMELLTIPMQVQLLATVSEFIASIDRYSAKLKPLYIYVLMKNERQ